MDKNRDFERLKTELSLAKILLKESPNLASDKAWVCTSKGILEKLESNHIDLQPLEKELEDFSIFLLWRVGMVTSELSEVVPSSKELLTILAASLKTTYICSAIHDHIFASSEQIQYLDIKDNNQALTVQDFANPLSQIDSMAPKAESNYSYCILDLKGNFVMADKMAESLFEKKREELLKLNLFDLMIPYSKQYLKNHFGETIFKDFKEDPKLFSFTIYSLWAYKKYQKTISNITKKDGVKKKSAEKKKFNEEEKKLVCHDNSIYYKYLQCLTARAIMIELQFTKYDDIINLEWTDGLKVNFENRIFSENVSNNNMNSKPGILLITRKSRHVQKFNYELMKIMDPVIVKFEERIEKKMMKIRKKFMEKSSHHPKKKQEKSDSESSVDEEEDDELELEWDIKEE